MFQSRRQHFRALKQLLSEQMPLQCRDNEVETILFIRLYLQRFLEMSPVYIRQAIRKKVFGLGRIHRVIRKKHLKHIT